MATAYIGVGSNMGDRLTMISNAVDAIAHLPSTHVEKVSHAYESAAAYHEDQAAFVNSVIQITTGLPAEDLLSQLLEMEDAMGRVRTIANGPRSIDLDLLLYGDEEWTSERLTLPHPGMLERDFVVTPLLEIAPHVTLPDGTHPRRRLATIGPIVRDLGEVPDAGVGHNMPVEPGEWVVVAESEGPQSTLSGFDADLMLKRSVLAQEGIPYAFEPFAPGIDVDFLGRPQVIALAVPQEYQAAARNLLAAVSAAPLIEPLESAAQEATFHREEPEPEE